MLKPLPVLAATLGSFWLTMTALYAAPNPAPVASLSDQDRAEIQALAGSYGRALGTCAAEAYAQLFAEPGGYFASGPRGKIVGHDKLAALVQSEPFCHDDSERRPRNIPPGIEIGTSAEGVTGRAALANNSGHYEDVYVKTTQGWKFKARTYISPQEEAAQLTAQDFAEIRRLAGNDSGQFDDVWVDAPGGKRFRSAGVVITPASEGAKGRARLKNDGGYYEDVYVRTPQGWRFKSRAYVTEASAAAGNH